MANILLINPTTKNLYENTKLKNVVPIYPPLGLLTIAGGLQDSNHKVRLLDLEILKIDFLKDSNKINHLIKSILTDFSPMFVGISVGSSTYKQCLDITKLIKEHNKEIIIIAGGAYSSSRPQKILNESLIDILIKGEGDFVLNEILAGKPLSEIDGIIFKENSKVIYNKPRSFLKDLDKLPFPAVNLINKNDYFVPHSVSKKQPVIPMESSRGCVWRCSYCTKAVFGKNFRVKSPGRVVKEIKYYYNHGYKEVHFLDDMPTTDIERMKTICRLLIKENLDLTWTCANGIRADCVDEELLKLMKTAGCWRIGFGIESGNQEILDNIDKDLKISRVEKTFKICHKIGLETIGYFMLALPGETEKTMRQTISFSKKLNPHFAKFTILTPLPSTPLYEDWVKKSIIDKSDSEINFHSTNRSYKHPNLSWNLIDKYYKKAYRQFYFRPNYIFRHVFRSLQSGRFFDDIKLLFSIKW